MRGHCQCHPHHHQPRKLNKTIQDGGDAFGSNPRWKLGRYGIGAHVGVTVVRESGWGR